MNSKKILALLLSAGLALAATGCKKEEAKLAVAEAAKTDDNKGDDKKEAAKPADSPDVAVAKAEAPKPAVAAGVSPEQIAKLKKMMEDETVDGKIKAAIEGLQLLRSAKVSADGSKFDPENQPIVAMAPQAVGGATRLLMKVLAEQSTDAEKTRIKAEVGMEFAGSISAASKAVRELLTNGSTCLPVLTDPAATTRVDNALNSMSLGTGFRSVFRCMMTFGPMEWAQWQGKEADQYGEMDRQVAVFIAQHDPLVLQEILDGWVGFTGKNAKLPDALVDHFAVLDNTGKNYSLNMLGKMCAKEQGEKLIAQINAGSDEAAKLWAKTLDGELKACK